MTTTETKPAAEPGKNDLALRPVTPGQPAGRDFGAILGIKPQTIDEAMKIATIIANSDLVPKDYKGKPGNVLIAWEMSSQLGIPAIQGLQNISVINGRAAVWGELATAIVRNHPLTEYLEMSDPEEVRKTGVAVTRHKRRDEPREHRYSFNREDAKTARLLNKEGPWTQYPNWMLQMRANAFCFKVSAPDMLKGMTIAEEARDIIETTAERIPEPQPAVRAATPAEAARASVSQGAQPASAAAQSTNAATELAKPTDDQGLVWTSFLVDRSVRTTIGDGETERKVAKITTAENPARTFFSADPDRVGPLAKEAKEKGVELKVSYADTDDGAFIKQAEVAKK